VVTLVTYDAKGAELAQGSGFIATANGAIVTCWHVVSGASKVKIVRSDGSSWTALGLLAWDTERDFAILKVSDSKLATLPLAASDTVRQGDRILAVGSPEGLEQTASDGIVSAIRGAPNAPRIIQITAAVSPGSSGGPVLNMRGQVIGIAAFVLSEGQNLNFAQPVDSAKQKLSTASRIMPFSQASPATSNPGAEKLCRRGWLETPQDDAATNAPTKYKRALDTFQQAIRADSGCAEAYLGAGFCLDALGRYDEAVNSYKDAIKLKPDMAEAHSSLSHAYFHLGRYCDAVDSVKEAITLEPEDAVLHYNIGVIDDRLGRYSAAADSFKEAIRLKPDFAEAHHSLGLAYCSLGRYNDAVDSIREAIRLKPNFAEAYSTLGTAYSFLNRYDDDVESQKESLRLKPDDAFTHYMLADAYTELGRYNDAIDSYKEAIRLKPGMHEAHYRLGVADLAIGDRGGALDEYGILKDLNADSAAKLFKLIYP
jgi:tetratricopeptide (TPR) repeat protein